MHHPDHDLSLIAGLAADDLTPAEHARAQSLLDSCTECSALRDDLFAIAQATRALPAQPAPHDFRISAEQASRLRRTSWVGRLLGPFSSATSAARPLAATFTTLGLIGVFVAAGLPGMLGMLAGSASMAAPERAGAGGGGVVAPPAVASAAPGAMFGPQAGATPGDDTHSTKDGASGQPTYVLAAGADGRDLASTPETDADADSHVDALQSPPNLLLIGSVGVLAVGLGLFGLRFAGRRLR